MTMHAIVKGDAGTFYSIDDPDWGYDTEQKAEVILDSKEFIGEHKCSINGRGGDGYVDGVQNEEFLPEGTYIVVYYRIIDGMSRYDGDYLSLADMNISKAQIIANAAAGKYVDGAAYYLVG